MRGGFDFETWLDSVREKTVHITAPDDRSLGCRTSRLYSSPVAHHGHQSYCADCDEFVLRIKPGGGHPGHCPRCGREPGLLEIGTVPDGR